MGRSARRVLPVAAALVVAGGTVEPLHAQAPADTGSTVRLTGFVSATLYAQDALFAPGNGQNAQVVQHQQDGPAGWWHGGDVRNTRVLLEADVAHARDWKVGGLLEIDLFGGFPSGEAFDREQAYPRLRLAYAGFERSTTRIRVGQDWAPISHDMPASVNRLAFPPGWGAAGVIGWRFPGVFIRHLLHDGALQAHVHAAAMRGNWTGDADRPDHPTAAQATLVPQLQAALSLAAGPHAELDWSLTAGVHADRKRAPRRTDEAAVAPSGWAAAASGRVAPGRFVLRAGGYTGRATGHLATHVSQLEDVGGWGGWGQLGIDLNAGWGARFFVGMDAPDEADILALDSGILENRTASFEVRHEPGPWGVAFEWQHTRTEWWHSATTNRGALRGNQAAMGVVVRF
jgi:hypothetical protein